MHLLNVEIHLSIHNSSILLKKIIKSIKEFLPLYHNLNNLSMKYFLLTIITSLALSAKSQLVIDNATFFIGENAVVTVQGNLTTNVAIMAGGSGATRGKIQMKGAAAQTITINSATASIPRLEVDNINHVKLAGTNDLRIDNQLDFTNGKLQLGTRNILLPEDITITGAGAGKFIETNGTGVARQLMTTNGTKVVPIGTGTHFNPTTITTTGSSFGANAFIGVRSTGSAVSTPQRHPRTETFLNTAFAVTPSGVTGGTVNVVGTYTEGQITGLGTPVEADLNGLFWDGTSWSMAGGTQNPVTNTIGANVSASGGLVYGMNKFVLANLKTFLQGAYNSTTGLMRDQLRTTNTDPTPGLPPVSPLIPTSDPYRTADYSAAFTHVNNSVGETINSSILNNASLVNNNIVDWVFLELRDNNMPSNVLQTRSALIQRDGDIVDIDGISPVYFKNQNASNYNIAIRHRNHVGVRTANVTALGLNSPTTLNLSSSASNYLNANAAQVSPSVFGLFGGNANVNTNTRISGANGVTSDFEFLKSFVGSLPQRIGYSSSDVNMNRNARISGADAVSSDFEFIKLVLGSSAQRLQGTF